MKKILVMLALVFACLWGTAFAADFSQIVILHTNDTHGYDQRADGVNGMATVAALKEDYEAKGYKVLLVDAGDAIQDSNLVNFSKGKTAIDFMNAVGYDAMTLGNHEFDYGSDVTLARIKQAKFPIVSANIIVDATGKPFTGKTHAIIRKGDLKIGVFGLTTPSTITTSNPKSTRGLTFLSKEEMYKAAQKEVDVLKAAHCDLIVAIGHLGSEPDAVGDRSNDVLANVKGIDVFIDGHDHTVKNLYIDGSLLTETGSHLANIGVVHYEDGKWQEDLHAYGQFNKEDAKIKAIVDKAQAAINKKLATKVGTTPFELNGSRDPGVRTEETNLGDFIADAYLWQVRQAAVLDRVTIDGALMNGGSIRAGIKAGAITEADLLRVLPYHNYLQYVTMKGSTLLEILEAATCTTPTALGAFPQVAGIVYTVDTKTPFAKGELYPHSVYYRPAAPGSRVTITSVGGKPFDPEATYNIAVPDFLTSGGDSYYSMQDPAKVTIHDVDYLDTDAVRNYLKELGGTVSADYKAPQGRITLTK